MMLQRFAYAALALLVALILVIGVNTLRHASRQLQVPPAPPLAIDIDAASQRLAAGVRLRTVSHDGQDGASAAELLGTAERSFELGPDATVASLRRALAVTHPDFERWGARLAISVEGELAADSRILEEGSEVALLPPVSGG